MDCDVRIPLTKGYETIVSAEDAHLADVRWYAHADPDGTIYALRKQYVPGSTKRVTRRLHREVVGAPAGLVVDHINGDTLDNRRANLRVVSHIENVRNTDRPRPCSNSQIRGVNYLVAKNRWRGTLKVQGRTYLGPARRTPEEASLDRLKLEKEHLGIQPRRRAAFISAGLSD